MSDIKKTVNTVLKELKACLGAVDEKSITKALELIAKTDRIFCTGAGRSGLAVKAFAMRLMHLGKSSYVIGEIATPAAESGDLLVIGSGSGRTPSMVAAAEKAKKLGLKILLFTIDPKSPIAKIAHTKVVISAPSEKAEGGKPLSSIQPMGSMFEQSLFLLLDSMIVDLMKSDKQCSGKMFGKHANLE
ncbi:MAG: 6-phospho-3-hexuloisomerase [Planctomycetota bacterium]|jgi:6-phospho-3-hexuloisomerase